MRFALLLVLAACVSRERPPAIVGTPLGESTAPGPVHPIYPPEDANIVLSRSISPGLLAGATAGGPAPTATPAPAAAPAPAPAPAAPPPTVASESQPNVESPPPPPEP